MSYREPLAKADISFALRSGQIMYSLHREFCFWRHPADDGIVVRYENDDLHPG